MRAALLAALLCLPGLAAAQSTVVGDAWATGSLGVGTTSPSARMEVVASSAQTNIFQVSGVDETPFFLIDNQARLGLGRQPRARVDVSGSGDSGDVGAILRSGNLFPSTSDYQITLGFNGKDDLRHAVRSQHRVAASSSSLDFLIWSTNVSSTTVGDLNVMSLVTFSTEAAVHVMPVAGLLPHVELEVSNAASLGGGTVHRLLEAQHSSRELKDDISPLEETARSRAYDEMRGLKHVRFRYMSRRKGRLERDKKQPLRVGLLYEEAPASIQGPGESIVVDDRVTNLELAAQELADRLERADQEAAGLKP